MHVAGYAKPSFRIHDVPLVLYWQNCQKRAPQARTAAQASHDIIRDSLNPFFIANLDLYLVAILQCLQHLVRPHSCSQVAVIMILNQSCHYPALKICGIGIRSEFPIWKRNFPVSKELATTKIAPTNFYSHCSPFNRRSNSDGWISGLPIQSSNWASHPASSLAS